MAVALQWRRSLLEFVGVLLCRLAEEGGVGVGRVLPLGPFGGALLGRIGGSLLGRPLDPLLQHAHVFLRQLPEGKRGAMELKNLRGRSASIGAAFRRGGVGLRFR